MKKEIVTYSDPKSSISEIFRTLRTNIQFMNSKENAKTILITSILPAEGKSWITANLATTFAQAGKKVLIVDADMRKGRQHVIFDIQNSKGLSNYLSQRKNESVANYISATEVDNLFILPAGKVPANPSELLDSKGCVNMIKELREVFDIVIFDGTPTALVADSMILAGKVDTTIIVAKYNKTKKEDLIKLKKDIKNIGGRIAGVVINRQDANVKRYENNYYYYGESQLVKAKK